jgi:putative membrane protein
VLRFFLRSLVTAIALGVAVWAVPGLSMTAFSDANTQIFIGAPSLELTLTYLLIAAVFGIVNAIVGNTIRVVAFPLYILTLGLIALVVNALMLLLVHQISLWLGFGLAVDGFGSGVLGALVLSITSWIIGLFFRPLLRRGR